MDRASIRTRRHALKLLGVADPAAAGRTWCRLDPVVWISGQNAYVYVSSYTR